MKREIEIKNESVFTSKISNFKSKTSVNLLNSNEFSIRISEGTDKTGTDKILTSKDFKLKSTNISTNKLEFEVYNSEFEITAKLIYETRIEDFFMRKHIEFSFEDDVCLERINVEDFNSEDIYQVYKAKQITSQKPAGWRPGLGQPLYSKKSALFLGVEFPASFNFVEKSNSVCGYLNGSNFEEGDKYTTHKSVIGVAENNADLDNSFFEYIDQTRKRKFRLQIQYNSWFDFGPRVSREKFIENSKIVHNELVKKRGVKPFRAYVIDDGWQDSRRKEADWSKKVWTVNNKFDSDLGTSQKTIESFGSDLGIWLSPGCLFGATPMIKKMSEAGMEGLEFTMSMCGEKYMSKLEDRLVELTKQGISYYKFDGIFGHLNTRAYELNGRGCPTMPQLKTEGFKPTDKRLNDSKYDELKSYYLVKGSERLIKMFNKMSEANPEVYICISNGAYLSPWWMQHVDVVWMINAGDAAGGSNRNQELTYRDGVYYDIWKKEGTKYPMHSVFNHEPKKTKTGEDKETFKKYLYMNLSRGTGFIEFYLKTKNLVAADWDVIADGLNWTYGKFPAFKYVRMHGGDPKKKETYGYFATNKETGYISIHNPSDKLENYKIRIDENLGNIKPGDNFVISSVFNNYTGKRIVKYGDVLEINIKPKDIIILNLVK
jgi:hypothetical protein